MTHEKQIKELQRLAQREENKLRGMKQPNRLQRIMEWYQSGKEISEDDHHWRGMMQEAYDMMLEGKNKTQVARWLGQQYPDMEPRLRYTVIGDALDLFGALHRGNKAGLRAVLTERLLRLSLMAEEKNDADLSRRILGQIGKMNNLEQDEQQVEKKRRVNIFRYSTDATVLQIEQHEEETKG